MTPRDGYRITTEIKIYAKPDAPMQGYYVIEKRDAAQDRQDAAFYFDRYHDAVPATEAGEWSQWRVGIIGFKDCMMMIRSAFGERFESWDFADGVTMPWPASGVYDREGHRAAVAAKKARYSGTA